ncbi:hypothetical protein R3P38DRAFT_2507512, partial [Favolaschia claudopus]
MQPAGSPAIPSALRLDWSATQTESAIAQTATLDTDHSTYNSFRGSVHTAAVQRSTFNVHAKQSDQSLESFIKLSLQEKNAVINYLVAISKVSADILRNMVPRHEGMAIRISGGKRKDAASLRADFGVHQCTKACLISESEAVRAGFAGKPALGPTELQESSLVLNLRSANKKRKASFTRIEDPSLKKARHSAESSTPKTSFPFILPQTEKDKIICEFIESTSNAALKRYECSFCGKLELATAVKIKTIQELDISMLDRAVQTLRLSSSQPRIESFKASSLINGSTYVLCHLCGLSVSKNKFQTIPLRSYANGLWIGEVPLELRELTFLEEQCIARARATKCMYKIKLGPSGQLAARGNVCILPQDTSSFVS